MAEISNQGYKSIRNYIIGNWVDVQIQDTAGNEIFKFKIPNYGAFTMNANDVVLEFTLTGADVGATESTPKEFGKVLIYESNGTIPIIQEVISNPVTLTKEVDKVTIVETIKVPLIM